MRLSAVYHSLRRAIKLLFYVTRLIILGTLVNVGLCSALLLVPFNPSLAYDLTCNIAETLWGWMQHVFEVENHAHIAFHGDDVVHGASAIVIANHQVYADYYSIHALAQRAGMLGRLRYFAKESLKWLPLFGWSLWASGMILVKRNWVHDERLIQRAFKRIKHQKRPLWIVSYPEGTRRTDVKVAQSQAFCRKLDKPQLQEVLWPRTKGFVASISELRDGNVEFIYDMTIVYDGPLGFNVPPNLPTLHSTTDLRAAGWRFYIDVRRIRIMDLPRDQDELARWLEDAFIKKDRLIRMLRSQCSIKAKDDEQSFGSDVQN